MSPMWEVAQQVSSGLRSAAQIVWSHLGTWLNHSTWSLHEARMQGGSSSNVSTRCPSPVPAVGERVGTRSVLGMRGSYWAGKRPCIGPQELVAHVQGNWVWVSFNCGKQSTGSQKGHREQGGAREGTGNDLASTGSAPTETKTHGRRAVVWASQQQRGPTSTNECHHGTRASEPDLR